MSDIDSNLIHGNIDTIILKTLSTKDCYGYEIIKEIQKRSGGEYIIKQPTLYSSLKRLETQGFISSRWGEISGGGRRKYFSLTDLGKEVFNKYNSEWQKSRNLINTILDSDEPEIKVIHTALDEDDFDETYTVSKRRARPKKPKSEETTAVVNESAPKQNTKENTNESQPVTASNADIIDVSRDSENIVLRDIAEKPREVDVIDTQAAIKQLFEENYNSKNVYSDSYVAATSFMHPIKEEPPRDEPIITEQPQEPEVIAPKPPIQPKRIESLPEREYKSVIAELVAVAKAAKRVSEPESVASSDLPAPITSLNIESIQSPPIPEPEEDYEGEFINNDKISLRDITTTTTLDNDLGDEIIIRVPNNSDREFQHKYYYYSNRLRINQSLILYISMLACEAIAALAMILGGARMSYDWIIYLIFGLLPIGLFFVNLMIYAKAPNKTKHINFNLRNSLLIRLVFFIQALVIIYCVCLCCGMPIGFSIDYLPLIIIPTVCALFIPISPIVFDILNRGNKYSVN